MPAQTYIIHSVNELLKKKGFQLELNTGGVCGGLACIYVKYFLEGREKEFFEMERKLANPPKNYSLGDDPAFDQFIHDVEISFNSQVYHEGTYQGDLDKILKFDGKPVNNEYNIGLMDSTAKWGELLASIKNEGRACYVASNNHAIAVSFSNNQYVIYDPNYNLDSENDPRNNTKVFTSAAAAIKEIEERFGVCNDPGLYKDNLGISVRVFAHPNETRPGVYPVKADLHRRHFPNTAAYTRKITTSKGYVYDALKCAIRANDTETIEHLVQTMPLESEHCSNAVHHNRFELAMDIFKRLSPNQAVVSLFYTARYSKASFLEPMLKYYFDTHLNTASTALKVNYANDLLRDVIAGQDNKNIEVLARFIRERSITVRNNSLIADTIISASREKIIKDKSGFLESLVTHFPDLLTEKVIIDLLKSAAANNSRKSLKILLGQVNKLSDTSKTAILNRTLLSTITGDNLKLIVDAGIPVSESLLATALDRKEPEIFSIYVGALKEDNPWNNFLKQAIKPDFPANTLLPLPLFDASKPFTTFKVLTRFHHNAAILANWPRKLPSQAIRKEALLWAVKTGNVAMVEKLKGPGIQLETAQLLRRIAEYPNRTDDMYKFLLRQLQELFPDEAKKKEQMLNAAADIRRASFNKDPNLLKQVAALFRDVSIISPQSLSAETQSLFNQSQLLPALNPEMDRMQYVDQDEQNALQEALRAKKYPAEQYAYQWAILHKEFEFADALSYCFNPDNPDFAYNLFLTVNRKGDEESLNYLLNTQTKLLADVKTYQKLEKDGQYSLITKLIKAGKLLDDSYRLQLLNKAVERQDSNLIEALKPFINRGYSTNAMPIYIALTKHNSKGAVMLLKQGALLKGIPPSDVLDAIIRSNDIHLLHQAFADSHFRSGFLDKSNLMGYLETIHQKASPALLKEFKNLFPQLNFDNLKDHGKAFDFSAFGEVNNINELFAEACKQRCLTIVNTLLETYKPDIKDEKEKAALFANLDLLFDSPIKSTAVRGGLNPQMINERRKAREAAASVNNPPLQQQKGFQRRSLSQQQRISPQPVQRPLPQAPVKKADESQVNEDMVKHHWRTVFDSLYQQKLARLYSFIKETSYAPFEDSHRDIGKMILNLRTSQRNLRELVDSGKNPERPRASKSSLLENKLILRALDEDDQEKLLALMQQIKPEKAEVLDNNSATSTLTAEIMGLFKKYAKAGQTQVIANLFHFYEANSVIKIALEKAKQGKDEWETLVGLLQSCSYAQLEKELKIELNQYRDQLFSGFKASPRDIRPELAHLLDKKNDSALASILRTRREDMNVLLENIQGKMVEADTAVDGKAKVSRIILGLNEFKAAIDSFQIRYNKFLETLSTNSFSRKEASAELAELKTIFERDQLASYYITDGALLDYLFAHPNDLGVKQRIDRMSQTFVSYLEGFQKQGFNAETALQQLEGINQAFKIEGFIPAYFAEEKWIESLFGKLDAYKQNKITKPAILDFLTDLYKVISVEFSANQEAQETLQGKDAQAEQQKLQAEEDARLASERALKNEQAEKERLAQEQKALEEQERLQHETQQREEQER
ncbi:MAP7 domain-containing protein, partial [Legionella birminghamensis]